MMAVLLGCSRQCLASSKRLGENFFVAGFAGIGFSAVFIGSGFAASLVGAGAWAKANGAAIASAKNTFRFMDLPFFMKPGP
jgi:hypothetical protein